MLSLHLFLQTTALLSAALYARRRPSHRPLFWLLFAWTASTWLCLLLAADMPGIIRPPDPALPPLVGPERTAFCMYTCAQLAWPIGLAAAATHLYARGRWSTGIEVWFACAIFLLAMPDVRGEDMRLFLLAMHLGCLSVVACAAAANYHYRLPAGPAHHCLLLCALAELGVTIAGPWRLGLWGYWPLALLGYSILSATMTLYQGLLLWTLPRRSSPS